MKENKVYLNLLAILNTFEKDSTREQVIITKMDKNGNKIKVMLTKYNYIITNINP